MSELLRLLATLLVALQQPRDLGVCQKCGANEGTIFCRRSMLGEPGACVFVRKSNDAESTVGGERGT